MITFLCIVAGTTGVHLLYTRFAYGQRGLRSSNVSRRRPSHRMNQWMAQAGLPDVRVRDVAVVCTALFTISFLLTFAVFGGVVASLIGGVFAATWPLLAYRQRRLNRIASAQEAWPRMIEEIRILTGSAGTSVPQALFQVGRRSPRDLVEAFDVAHREWMLTTDFERALAVLKTQLADPTADAACETLLTAHQVGGIDLDRRLTDLADDRRADVQGRKDARAKQSGARFARAFVIIVPIGMALVGLTIGEGRAAYQSAGGQLAVVFGLSLMAGCWLWAGRIMAIPPEQRVFADSDTHVEDGAVPASEHR